MNVNQLLNKTWLQKLKHLLDKYCLISTIAFKFKLSIQKQKPSLSLSSFFSLLISQLILYQIKQPRTVLESAQLQDSKTVFGCLILPRIGWGLGSQREGFCFQMHNLNKAQERFPGGQMRRYLHFPTYKYHTLK